MSAPATQKCRVCGAEAPETATRCPNCTAALGALAPCPHCRAIAGVSPNAELRFVCDVCGGPRVPAVHGVTTSGREARALVTANTARKSRDGFRALGVATGLLGAAYCAGLAAVALIVLLGALSIGHGLLLAILMSIVGVPLAATAFFARSRARARAALIPPALDEAWVAATSGLARARGGDVTPADVAAAFGVDEALAEELVAELDVDAALGGADAGPPRARIATPTRSTAHTAGDAAVAEAEAEAEAAAGDPAKRAARLP